MFSLAALDRPTLALLTRAARAAHGCVFAPFKSAAEANALAERCGLQSEIDAESLRHLMLSSRACHWCEKSLGKKLTAVFAHLRPLAAGGANTLENTAVVCQKCARTRVSLQVCRPPMSSGAAKARTPDHVLALEEPGEVREEPDPKRAAETFHTGWVYITPGDQEQPWIFLAWGEASFADRLQHLKYSAPSGSTEFHVANEPLSAFRGLVVRSGKLAESMLREVNRAGKVMVLAG